ncbi:MAG TPA: DUF4105 domain-containing protein [Kofleriaceae bacterium]
MIRALVVLALLAIAAPARADVDEPPVVEVITFGPGAGLFERFGHAAMCLRYQEVTHDVCFNYGVTDYSAGASLIWNFIRGTQLFWSEPANYYGMIDSYTDEDRDIWRQTIPTTPSQSRAIEKRLWHDTERENREYIYDHVYNNCATRLRDILDEELATPEAGAPGTTRGALRNVDAPTDITLRAVESRGFAESPLLLAFTEFGLGHGMDRPLPRWDAMFLPEVLRAELTKLPGVITDSLNQRQAPPFKTDAGWSGRLVFAAAAVFFPLLAWVLRKKRRLSTGIAMTPLVVWCVLIWTLVIISPIALVRWNEVALVFLPTDLAIPWLGRRRALYLKARIVELLLLAIASAVGLVAQPLWIPLATALLPLMVLFSATRAVRGPDPSGSAGTDSN